MPAPYDIPMPPDLDIGPTYTLRVTALDLNTGALISGVNVSNIVLTVDQIQGTPDGLAVGPFMLVPGPGA